MDIISKNVYFMVIRYGGLKPAILKFILDTVSERDTVDVKAVYNIKWNASERKENLLSFYDHVSDKKAIKDIMEVNGLDMMAIILYDNQPTKPPLEDGTNSGDNWNTILLKRIIRSKFGNVVHVSDTSVTAHDEIDKLLGLSKKELSKITKSDKINMSELSTNSYLAKYFNKDQDMEK